MLENPKTLPKTQNIHLKPTVAKKKKKKILKKKVSTLT